MDDETPDELYNDANDAVRCRGELARVLHEAKQRVRRAQEAYDTAGIDRDRYYLMGRRDEAERALELLCEVQHAG